ncbi:MAG TPA: MarR family transcriptional regulator [Polyangiaceae bacterium]
MALDPRVFEGALEIHWHPYVSALGSAGLMHRDVTDILDDLRRIVQVLRESSRAAERRLGVTGAQLFVLRALADERALSLNTLAERTRTHQSTVSVVVKRLARKNLVHRKTSASDGRRVELELSARGRTLLDRAPHAAQDQLIAGIERLYARERRALARGLGTLVEHMGLRKHPAPMFFEEKRKPGSRKKTQRATG